MPDPSFPILDLGQFDAGPQARRRFVEALGAAARDIGFLYLIGHGIPEALGRSVFALSRKFFALPEEEKLAIEMVNSSHFRGYTRVGRELTRGQPDRREQLDVGLEAPALTRVPADQPWLRLQGPNQWPSSLPELRPVLLEWQEVLTRVLLKLLGAFALALEQPEGAFDDLVGSTANRLLKIIRYPGSRAGAADQGVGAHKDSGILTAVWQDETGGLEVEVEAEAGFIPARPVPGALVINIGELLELATGGYLKATVHRVVSPSEATDRLSVAFFLGARLDAQVKVLPLPERLRTLVRGLSADPLNPLFQHVGRNYLKGRLRSHVDVARRHYPELDVDAAGNY
jgi:isopenicillin N synthase-like dioxygenase